MNKALPIIVIGAVIIGAVIFFRSRKGTAAQARGRVSRDIPRRSPVGTRKKPRRGTSSTPLGDLARLNRHGTEAVCRLAGGEKATPQVCAGLGKASELAITQFELAGKGAKKAGEEIVGAFKDLGSLF